MLYCGNMNVLLYRKIYLSENWGSNEFSMLNVGVEYRKNHPLVASGQAFWVNDSELCIGYHLNANPAVFRPVFSHKRQRLLEVVNADILHPSTFWHAVRMRYWQTICHLKQLPLACVDCIVRFLY